MSPVRAAIFFGPSAIHSCALQVRLLHVPRPEFVAMQLMYRVTLVIGRDYPQSVIRIIQMTTRRAFGEYDQKEFDNWRISKLLPPGEN
jgi:hypothetical protein